MIKIFYKIFKNIIFISFYGCVALLIIFSCIWVYIGKDFPDIDNLKNSHSKSMTRVFDRFGDVVCEWSEKKRVFVSIEEIPSRVIKAFLSAEDKNFLTHSGIDVFRLIKTLFLNTIHKNWKKSPKGASTITQQVAKNFIVGSEKNIVRKLKEAILSIKIEREIPKKKILELYLNNIYFGRGSYGVAFAALSYFSKRLDELDFDECAFLASLPKAPSVLNDPDKCIHRRNWVLKQMCENGFLKKTDLKKYLNKKLILKKERFFQTNYFLEEVRKTFLKKNQSYDQGWSIFTTMDPEIQKIASESLQIGLEKFNNNYEKPKLLPSFARTGRVVQKSDGKILIKVENETFWTESKWYNAININDELILRGNEIINIPEITGGIVVLDADNGEILALVGGYDYNVQKFNCATQAMRQIGSTFKPFVYMSAFESGYKQSSIIIDEPIEIPLGNGLGVYKPKNITGISYGPTTLQVGLTQSRNIVTIKLAKSIGMKKIRNTATEFKIVENMPLQLAMALGACESTLLKLCAAYARMINGGYDIDPHFIKREVPFDALDAYTEKLPGISFDFKKNLSQNFMSAEYPKVVDSRKRIITKEISFIMRNLLENVVSVGTAKKISYLQKDIQGCGYKIGGKTGSTNDFKDAWFVGFLTTPSSKTYIIGVFVGFLTPKTIGENATGGKVALPIFETFIKKLMPHIK